MFRALAESGYDRISFSVSMQRRRRRTRNPGPVHAGQHITQQMFVSTSCHRRYTGSVTYQPHSARDQTGLPASQAGATLVGRFSFTVPRK